MKVLPIQKLLYAFFILLGICFLDSCGAKKNIKKTPHNDKISKPIPSRKKVNLPKNGKKEIYFPGKDIAPIDWEPKKDTLKKDPIDY